MLAAVVYTFAWGVLLHLITRSITFKRKIAASHTTRVVRFMSLKTPTFIILKLSAKYIFYKISLLFDMLG